MLRLTVFRAHYAIARRYTSRTGAARIAWAFTRAFDDVKAYDGVTTHPEFGANASGRYWLCCGSQDPSHKDRSCVEAKAGHPERCRFGTAAEHSEWQLRASGVSAPQRGDWRTWDVSGAVACRRLTLPNRRSHMAFDETTTIAMRDVARLEQEIGRLRVLLGKAADHITDHNNDYHHRTPREFIAELRNAAMGLPRGVAMGDKEQGNG